ncbi:MAG TPA: iron-containing alcohol dehydrogenase [Armatimonadota bacterium]|nr:iron-containing alcohol dehydrogenase [Armatimonadota bacterium]
MSELQDIGLRKIVVPETVFGNGARHLAGRYAGNLAAHHALVITDTGVLQAGWVQDVLDSLNKEGISHTIYQGVTSNPKVDEVMQGSALYHQHNCDIIIAVGGGSPMDCAKGVGIVSSNGRNIRDYEGIDTIPLPSPPLICVPTTAGSAADVSQFAIITDLERRLKMAIISKILVPDVALVDPETTVTQPKDVTISAALDAFSHAIEAAASTARWALTDLYAHDAIRRIHEHFPYVLSQPDDLGHRSQLLYGSMLAGLAFSSASLGLIHALSHGVGGWFDTTHGLSNAVLMPYVIAYNYPSAPDAYDAIGRALGLSIDELTPDERLTALLREIHRINQIAGAPTSLGELGVTKENIPTMVSHAMHDVTVVTNPRRPTEGELEVIYEQAL